MQLSHVTHDSQQRGHYLRDDLDVIIDMVTDFNETLVSALMCRLGLLHIMYTHLFIQNLSQILC